MVFLRVSIVVLSDVFVDNSFFVVSNKPAHLRQSGRNVVSLLEINPPGTGPACLIGSGPPVSRQANREGLHEPLPSSAICCLSGLLLQGCAAKQEITHVDVFTSGQDGYHTYRIPAVETAPRRIAAGVYRSPQVQQPRPRNARQRHRPGLQAQHRRRQDLVGDDGAGRPPGSAGPPATRSPWWIGPPSACGCSTTAPSRTAAVRAPGSGPTTPRPGGATAGTTGSPGRSPWTSPQSPERSSNGEALSSVRGGAIQNAKGRLIVPVSQTTGKGDGDDRSTPTAWTAFVIYSDDHGETWTRGQLAVPHHQREPTGRAGRWKPADGRPPGRGSNPADLAQQRRRPDLVFPPGPGRWCHRSPRASSVTPWLRPATTVTGSSGQDPRGPGGRPWYCDSAMTKAGRLPTNGLSRKRRRPTPTSPCCPTGASESSGERGGYAFLTFTRFDLGFAE